MIRDDRILREVVLSEKATNLQANLNRYTFKVAKDAPKEAIAQAVRKAFDVEVARVNILNVKPKIKPDRTRRGKYGLKAGYRKAIVTLKEGSSIELV